MAKIETTLTQGSNSIVLVQDNADIMSSITWDLYLKYATSISTFYAGSEFADPNGQCTSTCSDAKNVIRNLEYAVEDSVIIVDPVETQSIERIDGGLAENVSMCGEGCSACNKWWWSDSEDMVQYECTDYTVYKYSN